MPSNGTITGLTAGQNVYVRSKEAGVENNTLYLQSEVFSITVGTQAPEEYSITYDTPDGCSWTSGANGAKVKQGSSSAWNGRVTGTTFNGDEYEVTGVVAEPADAASVQYSTSTGNVTVTNVTANVKLVPQVQKKQVVVATDKATKLSLELKPRPTTGTDADFARPQIGVTFTDADDAAVATKSAANVVVSYKNTATGATTSYTDISSNMNGTTSYDYTLATLEPGTYEVTASFAGGLNADGTINYTASTSDKLTFTVVKPDVPVCETIAATDDGKTIHEQDGIISITGSGPFEYTTAASTNATPATPINWHTVEGTQITGLNPYSRSNDTYHIRSAKRVDADSNTIYLASDQVDVQVPAQQPVFCTVTAKEATGVAWTLPTVMTVRKDKGTWEAMLDGSVQGVHKYTVTGVAVEPEGAASVAFDSESGKVTVSAVTQDITLTPQVKDEQTVVDKSALSAAIAAAKLDLASVKQAENAKDVLKKYHYVTPQEAQALQAAINTAQGVANNDEATEQDVADASAALQQAVQTFDAAKKQGTKEPSVQNPIPTKLTAELVESGLAAEPKTKPYLKVTLTTLDGQPVVDMSNNTRVTAVYPNAKDPTKSSSSFANMDGAIEKTIALGDYTTPGSYTVHAEYAGANAKGADGKTYTDDEGEIVTYAPARSEDLVFTSVKPTFTATSTPGTTDGKNYKKADGTVTIQPFADTNLTYEYATSSSTGAGYTTIVPDADGKLVIGGRYADTKVYIRTQVKVESPAKVYMQSDVLEVAIGAQEPVYHTITYKAAEHTSWTADATESIRHEDVSTSKQIKGSTSGDEIYTVTGVTVEPQDAATVTFTPASSSSGAASVVINNVVSDVTITPVVEETQAVVAQDIATSISLAFKPVDPNNLDTTFARPFVTVAIKDADGNAIDASSEAYVKLSYQTEDGASGAVQNNMNGTLSRDYQLNELEPGAYTAKATFAGGVKSKDGTKNYLASESAELAFTVVKPNVPSTTVTDATYQQPSVNDTDGAIRVSGPEGYTGSYERTTANPANAKLSDWTAFGANGEGAIENLTANSQFYIRTKKAVDEASNTIYFSSEPVSATVGAKAPVYYTVTYAAGENARWVGGPAPAQVRELKGTASASAEGNPASEWQVTSITCTPEGAATVDFNAETGVVQVSNVTGNVTLTPVAQKKEQGPQATVIPTTLTAQLVPNYAQPNNPKVKVTLVDNEGNPVADVEHTQVRATYSRDGQPDSSTTSGIYLQGTSGPVTDEIAIGPYTRPGEYKVTVSYEGKAVPGVENTVYASAQTEQIAFTVVQPAAPVCEVSPATYDAGKSVHYSDGQIKVTGASPFQYSEAARATTSDWNDVDPQTDTITGLVYSSVAQSNSYYIRTKTRVVDNTVYLPSETTQAVMTFKAPEYYNIMLKAVANSSVAADKVTSVMAQKEPYNDRISGLSADASTDGRDYIVTGVTVQPADKATVEFTFETGALHVTNVTGDITITPVVAAKQAPASLELVGVKLNRPAQADASYIDAQANMEYTLKVLDAQGNPCPKVSVLMDNIGKEKNNTVNKITRTTGSDGTVTFSIMADKKSQWYPQYPEYSSGEHSFRFTVKDNPELEVTRSLTVVQPDPMYNEAGADGVKYADPVYVKGVSEAGASDGGYTNMDEHMEYWTHQVRNGENDAPFINPANGEWRDVEWSNEDNSYAINGLESGSWAFRYRTWLAENDSENHDTAHLISGWNMFLVPIGRHVVTADKANSENVLRFREERQAATQGGHVIFYFDIPQYYVLNSSGVTVTGGSQTDPGYDVDRVMAQPDPNDVNGIDQAIAGDTHWHLAIDGITRNLSFTVKACPLPTAKFDEEASSDITFTGEPFAYIPGSRTLVYKVAPDTNYEFGENSFTFTASDGTENPVETHSYDADTGTLTVQVASSFASPAPQAKQLVVKASATLVPDAELDTSKLEAAIADARAAAQGVRQSADGADIEPADRWVTPAVQKELDEMLAEAGEALAADDATQHGVNAAEKALRKALEAYQPAAGTKKSTAPDPSMQTGKGGSAVGKGAGAAAAEKALTGLASDKDPVGAAFAPLALHSSTQGTASIKLAWKKASGAKKYVVYGNACGSKNRLQKLASVSGTSFNVHKLASGASLKKGTYHKFIIVALDAGDKVVTTSAIIHVATVGGKVGNHKKVSVKKSVAKKAAKLKRGKSVKLAAKTSAQSKKLKVEKHRVVCYESSNPKVATVSKSGKVKGVKKGSCYVYAYAQNGVYAKVKVAVK